MRIEDALRWFAVAEALVLIGWALAVLQEAAKFRPPNVYVRLITASYIVLVILAAIQSWISVGSRHHVLVLLCLRVLGLSYGLLAMAAMHRHYRYAARVARHAHDGEKAAARLRAEAGILPESPEKKRR